jgi:hypothetical protein
MSFTNSPVVEYTPVTSVGIELCDAAAPWLTTALAWYLDAIGAMLSPLHDLVTDQGFDGDLGYVPGYGQIFDPVTCPTEQLGYLAQFVGVSIPAGMSDSDARALIRAEQGMQRGSPGAIIAAAQRFLTTSFVVLQERTAADGTPDAYHAVVGFRPADLLTTEADLIKAVEAVKPGGIQITYVASAGYTWNEAINTWSADTFTWNAAFATQP